MNIISSTTFSLILFRAIAAVSFNLIEFTVARDVTSGNIGEIVWMFLLSGNIVLLFIAAAYCIAFLVWIVSPVFVRTTSIRSLRTFSVILSVPLIINLVLQIVNGSVYMRFLIGCTVFYAVLYVNFVLMKRASRQDARSKDP